MTQADNQPSVNRRVLVIWAGETADAIAAAHVIADWRGWDISIHRYCPPGRMFVIDPSQVWTDPPFDWSGTGE